MKMRASIITAALFTTGCALAQQVPITPDSRQSLPAHVIYVHEGGTYPIHCRALIDCSIEAPKGEKFTSVSLGDPEHFPDTKGSLPSRFYSIKPGFNGMTTTVHLKTDHDNEYGFLIDEPRDGQLDYTTVLKSDDSEINQRIAVPSTLVPREQLEQVEKEKEAAITALATLRAESDAKLREVKVQAIKDAPAHLRSYVFDRQKAAERPWNVSDILADNDHSMYIKRSVKADDLPSVVALGQNGKPEVVVPHYDPDRELYVIPQRIVDGCLSFGGQKKEKKLIFHLPEGA